MEQALNKRFVSISLKVKGVTELIEKLEKEKQALNEKIKKTIMSKKQLEYDQQCILLKLKNVRNSSKTPHSTSQSSGSSSILTPPKTPTYTFTCDACAKKKKKKKKKNIKKKKKIKRYDSANANSSPDEIPDEDLLNINDTEFQTTDIEKDHKNENNESTDDNALHTQEK